MEVRPRTRKIPGRAGGAAFRAAKRAEQEVPEYTDFSHGRGIRSDNFYSFRGALKGFLKNKKPEIPKHLTSVPLHLQYGDVTGSLVMMVIRRAMQDGVIYDGNYYDDSQPDSQPPYPLVFVVDK
jgi:hypothetical protein